MFNTYMTEPNGSCWTYAWIPSGDHWTNWIETTRSYCQGDEKIRLCLTANKIPDPPTGSPEWYTRGGKSFAWGWVLHPGLPNEWLAYSSYAHNDQVVDASYFQGVPDPMSVVSIRQRVWTTEAVEPAPNLRGNSPSVELLLNSERQ